MSKPIAILTADWHLREDTPICRIDDYQKAQWGKIEKIINKANVLKIPILHAGDIFHRARAHRNIEAILIQKLNKTTKDVDFYWIPGNHDLLGHSFNNFYSSSVGVINSTFDGSWSRITDYAEDIKSFKYSCSYELAKHTIKIAIIHEYIHNPFDVNKNIPGKMPKKIFEQLKEYDLILSGDNHETFTIREGNQLLVNPGSLMRMTADQIGHKPCFFIYYDDNTVQQRFFDINPKVIDRSHIEIQKERDEKINAFVKRMSDKYEINLSFEQNIKNYLKANKTRSSVEEIIWRNVDGCSR